MRIEWNEDIFISRLNKLENNWVRGVETLKMLTGAPGKQTGRTKQERIKEFFLKRDQMMFSDFYMIFYLQITTSLFLCTCTPWYIRRRGFCILMHFFLKLIHNQCCMMTIECRPEISCINIRFTKKLSHAKIFLHFSCWICLFALVNLLNSMKPKISI